MKVVIEILVENNLPYPKEKPRVMIFSNFSDISSFNKFLSDRKSHLDYSIIANEGELFYHIKTKSIHHPSYIFSVAEKFANGA